MWDVMIVTAMYVAVHGHLNIQDTVTIVHTAVFF
jgi:hypothetical protein